MPGATQRANSEGSSPRERGKLEADGILGPETGLIPA